MVPEWSQPELVAANGRRFAGFAAAVLAFIIDPSTRRFLLLSSPAKRGRAGWEIVNGGLEGGETLIDGVTREVAHEALRLAAHKLPVATKFVVRGEI